MVSNPRFAAVNAAANVSSKFLAFTGSHVTTTGTLATTLVVHPSIVTGSDQNGGRRSRNTAPLRHVSPEFAAVHPRIRQLSRRQSMLRMRVTSAMKPLWGRVRAHHRHCDGAQQDVDVR